MGLDTANTKNAKEMFGDGYGDMVYFEFAAEPNVSQPLTPKQAYELHWRLISFLKDQGYGFDGTSRLTTWERERQKVVTG